MNKNLTFRKLLFYKIIIIFFLLFCIEKNQAQTYNSFYQVDSATYQLYLQNDWKKVISVGKQGLNKKIDSYFIRMRLGIAYYKQNNYRQASKHFQNAYTLDTANEVVKEYLYYSYLFGGQTLDAQLFSGTFSPVFKQKLNITNKPIINNISVIFGTSQQTNNEDVVGIDIDNEQNIYGEQQFATDEYFGIVSIQKQIAKSLNISCSYTNLNIHNYSKIAYNTFKINNFKKWKAINEINITNTETKQNEIYAKLTYQTPYHTTISLATNYISGSSKPVNYSTIDSTIILYDTTTYTFPVDTLSSLPIISTSNYNYTNNVFSFLISKDFNNFQVSLGAVYSNFNNKTQYVVNSQIVYYPFGNLNLYLISNINYQKQTKSKKSNNSEIIFGEKIGFKLVNHCWFETSATIGNISNYTENEGAVVYNDLSTITKKINATFLFPFPKFNIILQTQYNEKENNYLTYTDITNYVYTPFITKNFNILCGIKINF